MVEDSCDDFHGSDAAMHAIRTIGALTRQAAARWIADFAPSMGAAISYYTFFSLAPLLVILIGLAGYVFGRDAVQGDVSLRLQDALGAEAAAMVEALIKSASNPRSAAFAIVTGLVTLLIAATTAVAEVQSALDRIWRAPPSSGSGWWSFLRRRFFAFTMVLGIGFLLLASLVVAAGLSAIGKWGPGWSHGVILLHVLHTLVSFALVTALFAMIYKILPRTPIQWQDVWVGSAVTALLFTVGKGLIGLYLGHSAISSTYGAAGSVVVVLLWVYYAAQIFLLGAEFTYVYACQHGSRAEQHCQAVQGPSETPYAAMGVRPTLEESRDRYR